MNYLNTKTSNILFEKAVKSKYYVDKSRMIGTVCENIGTEGQYICITRPRRFGKTINANMLSAYLTKGADSRVLFDHLKIAEAEAYGRHQNQHNVIHMDLSKLPDGCGSYEEYRRHVTDQLAEDLLEAYPKLREKEYNSVYQMFLDSGDRFVFVLDEWDAVFSRNFMGEAEKEEYLLFLKGLLKDQPYVDLAYMTGVLPVAKYSSGSELNMFDEYNFMNDNIYDQYFGFSEEEVRRLCQKQEKVSFEEMKQWYDGYYLSDGKSLFNPRSVNRALTRGICLNYWTETGPMNEIADCVEHNVDEVREDVVRLVAGIPVEAELDGYSAAELKLDSRDEILSAMVVYGFLAYYDGCLTIPNRELMEKFQRVLSRDSMGEVKEIVDRSREMLEATLACEEEKVAGILEEAHDRELPFLQYGDENSLSCVITLCYLYARKDYRIEREEKSGKGYCDYFFHPRKTGKPAIILELKAGKSCEAALAQIKKKNYLQKAESYKEVLLVAVNYDKDKRHTCRIERMRF